ncbi:MAG: hypothetical protein ACSHYB_01615 [Roseibacillus sp.]
MKSSSRDTFGHPHLIWTLLLVLITLLLLAAVAAQNLPAPTPLNAPKEQPQETEQP